MCLCICLQDHLKAIAEGEKRKDEELDRQVLLAEQRREEERFQQEERQREKMEKIKAVEGKMDGHTDRWKTWEHANLRFVTYCNKLKLKV